MIISGLQKMTLLDYPGRVACTVFLQGCNFRCPFCHNSGLLGAGEAQMTVQELLDFLQKRRGLLDGVCVTGGEPTLHHDLPGLLRSIRELGLAVKLDTNGSRPEMLRSLVDEGLVDYVAMDVKNCPRRCGETVGLDRPDLAALEQSLGFLLSGAVDYELRTTVVSELHDAQAMEEMGRWLQTLGEGKKVRRLFLQRFVDRDSVLRPGLSAPSGAEMDAYLAVLTPFAEYLAIRG